VKVWITKYALTKGIVEAEATGRDEYPNMVTVSNKPYDSIYKPYGRIYYHKPDWHLSLEDAKKRAEEMRVKRIASLRKSIQKLEKLSFGAEKGKVRDE
jgi:hypothetical protein